MKKIFDDVSYSCSRKVTESYSTSFSLATRMLDATIRPDIYNIYGFVRFADEIVDTFHDYDKDVLFEKFYEELNYSLANKISLNPILNSFQHTYHKYGIPRELVDAFMKSMQMDLTKKVYLNREEFKEYIYGSADVVGLMCLCVFVHGDETKYQALRQSAMALGSAFQKVNFLRDLKVDFENLERSYFPNTNLLELDEASKQEIIREIEEDFSLGYGGIRKLPATSRFGVYTAYRYYRRLLEKLKRTPSLEIKHTRIRVPNYEKVGLLATSYLNCRLQRV